MENKESELISMLHIAWKKSEDEVWLETQKKLQKRKIVRLNMPNFYVKWVAAASIVVIFSVSILIGTHTKTVSTLAMQHKIIELPDGSKMTLNAQSNATYKPYLWMINRQVKLNGEAFFEVQKGEKFKVLSDLGSTEVLGTSFNIYSRENSYEVTCITGKVKVKAHETNDEILLQPSQKAILKSTGKLNVLNQVKNKNSTAWMEGKLIFTSVPLSKVFDEIERQFNVKIIFRNHSDLDYTGAMKLTDDIEEILTYICQPFDVDWIRSKNNTYTIIRKD
ncbi:FecR family protein [Carboxylicivirga sediminis]|uniref:FecR family protein n=1 Tax=Carboxylicivirga sediminis TaxID=2006564 RepID=A0A941IY75_9BACT|nr:FecR family protein [Carboxylicivirga sediminis]MBR8536715.1 FecR family protein [Carboxylicivirga sediminis]